MALWVFSATQASIIAVALLFVYFGAQFRVSYVSRDHPTYTMACFWSHGILYDSNGRTVCRARRYALGCLDIMNNINTRSNGCDSLSTNAPFVHFGDEFGTFVEQQAINSIEISATIGAAALLVGLLLLVKRWSNSVYHCMVLVHMLAGVFAAMYMVNTRKAMDQMRRVDNDNAGQTISFGEGFIATVVTPLILLIHDKFVLDYKE